MWCHGEKIASFFPPQDLCFLVIFSGSHSSLCPRKSTRTLHPVGNILVGLFLNVLKQNPGNKIHINPKVCECKYVKTRNKRAKIVICRDNLCSMAE